jgi:hypothetical protein
VKINIWPYKYPQNSQEENEKKKHVKKKVQHPRSSSHGVATVSILVGRPALVASEAMVDVVAFTVAARAVG